MGLTTPFIRSIDYLITVMKKLSNTKKKKIKSILLKALNITCYILSGLFIVFIIIGLATPKQQNQNNIPQHQQVINGRIYDTLPSDYYYYRNVLTMTDYTYNVNTTYKIYKMGDSADTFTQVSYLTYSGEYKYKLVGSDTLRSMTGLEIWSTNLAPSSKFGGHNIQLNMLNTNYTLSNIYAYAYLGGNDNQYFCLGSTINLTIFEGSFTSNGEVFSKIQVLYAPAYATRFGDTNIEADTNTWKQQGYVYYMFTQYMRNDNTGVIVHSAEFLQLTNGSGASYSGHRYWTNYNYCNLYLFYEMRGGNSSPAFPSYSYFDLLKVSPTSYNGVTSYNFIDSFTAVFDLFGLAFTSWFGVFTIKLLPGLTLGTFLFMPLTITIMVALLKAVKH